MTTTDKLSKLLRSHDWWYSRSDDRRAHDRGAKSYSALCAEFHKLPPEQAQALWKSIAPDNFKPPTQEQS